MSQQVTSGLLFYPRGGSSQVIRYLRRALSADGWKVPLAVGSFGELGKQSNATTFFGGDQLAVMDYTAAINEFDPWTDPIAAQIPLHPSYEDRAGAPDRIFTAVSPFLAGHLTDAWTELLSCSELDATDVFHLHHLTPQYAAVARLWPQTPIIGHLHGTELKMIERIIERREVARLLGSDLEHMQALVAADAEISISRLSRKQRIIFRSTKWGHWRYGDFWESRMRAYARHCQSMIVISPHDRDLATRLFGKEVGRFEWVPNGVDTGVFNRQPLSAEERMALLRHWLIDDPQGWDESGVPGSVHYAEDDLQSFLNPATGKMAPVLMYVGRFLDFKRVPMLIRAYQQARPHFDTPAPLLIWGGNPGEWEGVHPHTVANEGNVDGIFFTGWRGHDDLSLGLNCADIMVAPSHEEPFGQVYLEAMASGLPVIASDTGGPLSFVNTDSDAPNGWFFPSDDIEALTATLIEVVNNPEERRQRADNAYRQIRRDFSWTTLARSFERIYQREIAAGAKLDAHEVGKRTPAWTVVAHSPVIVPTQRAPHRNEKLQVGLPLRSSD